jgi:HTH-type transcriptional regulator / antitoxin HigA
MDETKAFRTPGQLIEALLEERGWSNRVLAAVLEVEETGVSKLIAAKKAVTPETAIALEEVFGLPAERFLALQRDLDLAKARIVAIPDPSRARRAQLFADLPLAEMIRRQWLRVEDMRDMPAVEKAIEEFFDGKSPADAATIPHAARKTVTALDAPLPSQLAWIYRVKRIARELVVPRYDEAALKAAIPKLKGLLSAPEEARHAPRLLQECGVRLVIVEGLKSSKIDGVCLWLNEQSPVVGMTMRFDRMDNFWFVLRHELEHVLQRHGMEEPMLDVDIGASTSVADEEKIANREASEFCAPQGRRRSFLSETFWALPRCLAFTLRWWLVRFSFGLVDTSSLGRIWSRSATMFFLVRLWMAGVMSPRLVLLEQIGATRDSK